MRRLREKIICQKVQRRTVWGLRERGGGVKKSREGKVGWSGGAVRVKTLEVQWPGGRREWGALGGRGE